MGGSGSKLEKALEGAPEDVRYYGLENFGNTCYCNSVLQALYFCRPFRERLLQYGAGLPKDCEESLLNCLAELFMQIQSSKKKVGVIPPRRFVQRLKKDNELFRSYMHQDAHEFLNYLLNQVSEGLEKQQQQQQQGHGQGQQEAAQPASNGAGPRQPGQRAQAQQAPHTWLQDIFQGRLVSETRCLQCETITSREEVFVDLSLEIDQNCSLTSCLKQFSATETLDRDDKFFCDTCCCLQEAQKRMKLKQLPQCLCLHLKRFKYIESLARMRKLMHRVVFPLELKLTNTTADCEGADATYELFAVVVHVGSGPHHGHYVSLIKSGANWLFFDDDQVEHIPQSMVSATFGTTQEYGSHMDHGYILFYERVQQ